MKKTSKQLLFERMNTIGGMPLKENIDTILLEMFIGSLPDDFPNLVKQYAEDKNIGLDGAYYQFIGAFEKKFENDNAIEFKPSDDDYDKIATLMYGRFGDDAIEF